MGIREEVHKKLATSILPRIEGARAVRRWSRYIVYNLHRYLAEGALVVLGLGFSHPALVVISGGQIQAASNLTSAFANFNPTFLIGSFVLGLGWIAMRTYVSVEKLAEKGPLTVLTIRELESARAEIDNVLATMSPLKALGELQGQVKASVDRAYQAGSWRWALGPSSDAHRVVYAAEAKRLCDDYGDDWKDVAVERREPEDAS